METIPIISESVQYGVIGICISLIVALCFIVKMFVNVILRFIEEIKSLQSTIGELRTSVEMLTIRTKMAKRSMQQSNVKNPPHS
jgi:sensor histidine kinase YesM